MNATKARSQRPGFFIGTRNESSLHRALKRRYAGDGDVERERGGFVCDAVEPGGRAVEIQTGSFAALKKKIPALVKEGPVLLVYPAIITKYIELYDKEGALIRRKKSPKKGCPWDIFEELIYAPAFVGLKGLTVEIALVDVTERRVDDGKGSWTRKGVSIIDRSLDAWRESIVLAKKRDWKRFLPVKGEFTVKDLAAAAAVRADLARKALYVFCKAGWVEKAGKAGKAWVYRF
jgi:hypothetical protein